LLTITYSPDRQDLPSLTPHSRPGTPEPDAIATAYSEAVQD
jgi:hypothetical protein